MLLQLHGKLHDQDGVLGRQAHRGQQAHLEVHIVGQATRVGRQQRPDDTQRHGQHDGQRHGPAFVQCGKAQEHKQNRDGIQQRSLCTRLTFLQRSTRPLIANARRHVLKNVFHDLHSHT